MHWFSSIWNLVNMTSSILRWFFNQKFIDIRQGKKVAPQVWKTARFSFKCIGFQVCDLMIKSISWNSVESWSIMGQIFIIALCRQYLDDSLELIMFQFHFLQNQFQSHLEIVLLSEMEYNEKRSLDNRFDLWPQWRLHQLVFLERIVIIYTGLSYTSLWTIIYGVSNLYDPWFYSDWWVEYYFVCRFHLRIFVSLDLKHSLSGSEYFATTDNSKLSLFHYALSPILLVYFSFQIKSKKKPIPVGFFRHIF